MIPLQRSRAVERDRALAARVGARVKERRLARGLTRSGLAARIGVKEAVLEGIEEGARVPSLDVLLSLAEALEVDVPELV